MLGVFALGTPAIWAEDKDKPEAAADEDQKPITTYIDSAASTSDPFAHSNVADRYWQLNVFEPLLSYNGILDEYEGRVAESWEANEEATEFIFHIREGVKFHNGRDCKAEDVKNSLEYGMKSPFNVQYSGDIKEIEVLDEYTVKVILNNPNSAFLHNNDRIFIMDTKEAEEQGDKFGVIENLAGTGPFKIESYVPDVEIKLVRNDDYYLGASKIPAVNFRVMTDQNSALMAFEAGDLDFALVPTTSFGILEDSGDYNTLAGQTTQCVYFCINQNANEALSNKLVRQALAYATDYEGVAITGVDGYADSNGKIMYQPLTIAAPEEEGIAYSYNPEKAKELLVEAGYPDGVDVGKITTSAGFWHEKAAQSLQAQWAEVGITVEVNGLEMVTALTESRAGNYDIGVFSIFNMLDFDYIGISIGTDGEEAKMVKITDAEDFDWERIDELLVLGRSTLDLEKRKEYYKELDDIVMDAAVMIPLFHTQLTYAWDEDLYVNTDKSYGYQYTSFWDAYWVESDK